MEAIYIGIGLLAGFAIGFFISKKNTQNKIAEAELEAKKILEERGRKAREKNKEMRKEFDAEVRERSQKLEQSEKRIKQKESTLNQKYDQVKKDQSRLDSKHQSIDNRLDAIDGKEKELNQLIQTQLVDLERIANLTTDEAREKMMEKLENEAKTMASSKIKEIVEQAHLTANKEAKKIVIQTIQRTAAEHAIENTVSVFHLENDDIKGRIIGREGRNIRAIEAATGIEVIVDDTPEAIILSGFDPVRREIARLSLMKLVSDGRIHPARIEEVVKKVSKQINEEIVETGERTVIDLGIHGLHPELIRMVGRMKYRSSYGQNLLQHSREVANLCATMASEIGLNAKKAKRAGLLHDIGKVPEDNPELPHAILGMQLAQKYGEPEDVCNAIGAHHDEIEMTCSFSPIIQACDAISGSRPGARREIVEGYIQRLKDLEKLALGFPGVTKSYAIQAGRELRVIVESEKVTDDQSDMLAFQISDKIMKEMQYPGQIKVTVIREKRAIAYAK
ncbi:UNVERIFIED_CONTAM: hypothetical protein GTU68_057258 [Idotea baltica]|nr:hypothetical protein [Idotea baltica]